MIESNCWCMGVDGLTKGATFVRIMTAHGRFLFHIDIFRRGSEFHRRG